MEKLWIKININPPPKDVDVLFLLEDKTCAVGFKRWTGEMVPSNVHPGDDEADVYFDSNPVAWQSLPLIDGKLEDQRRAEGPEEWTYELEQNGWVKQGGGWLWKSPTDGNIYRGPYQAWKLMKAEAARKHLLDFSKI